MVAARLILCNECGAKNRISRYRASHMKCGNCGKPLTASKFFMQPSSSRKLLTWLVISGLLSGGYFLVNERHGSDPKTTSTAPSHIHELSYQQSFNAPQMPIDTGVIRAPLRTAVAPLAIKTNAGSNYYVKLVDLEGQTVMTMYIEGGQHFETKVPLGTYEMRYAVGKVWYGTMYLFGPGTSYAKANAQFKFDSDGSQYSGYTVELIRQVGGNLGINPLSPSDF